MPEISTLILFASACIVLTATPGPDMLLIASRSISQGRTSGFMTYAGIAAGTYCHAFATALGLSQLFLAVPAAYEIVRWAGCAYLLYLAWKTLTSDGSAFAPVGTMRRKSLKRIFSEGFLTNLLNPKMALFMLALFPQCVQPVAGSIMIQTLVLATILNLTGFFINSAVVLLSNEIRNRVTGLQRFKRLPQYFLATVFTGLACRIALGTKN